MRLHILGSGTCADNPTRTPASYFLETTDRKFLIDPGPGSVNKAISAGLDPFDIDAILLTHHHLDHCSDLPYYLFAYRNGRSDGWRDVTIIAPTEFLNLFDAITAPFKAWLFDDEKFSVNLIDANGIEWVKNGLSIRSAPMFHGAGAIGYRFADSNGSVFVYSGDTGYCDSLIELARDADLLLVEVSWPDGYEGEGHMRPKEVAKTGTESGAKHLALTHFYPFVDTSKLPALMKEHGYTGDVTVCHDGMTIKAP